MTQLPVARSTTGITTAVRPAGEGVTGVERIVDDVWADLEDFR